jgi:hypothetical protein
VSVASLSECRTAVERLGERIAGADAGVRDQLQDRTVSCTVTDLGVVFRGRLTAGGLSDLTDGPTAEDSVAPAQLRLAMSSDDLVALVDGQLNFAGAWASGRVRLEASIRDLLRLRGLLS